MGRRTFDIGTLPRASRPMATRQTATRGVLDGRNDATKDYFGYSRREGF